MQPIGPPYKERLRKQDKPGCGTPVCSIIDRKVKTFMSMCHFVEYLMQNGRYRTIFEVQKGSCEEASKFPFHINSSFNLCYLLFLNDFFLNYYF